MKPENLKSPFAWAQRTVFLQDRVWYIPSAYTQYDSYSFPGWDHPSIFGNDRPICVEYCSGNGAWIAEKAQTNPNSNWVAIEMKFERVRKIWSKMKNTGLTNLLIICGEGLTVTKHYFPSLSISEVYINFPDPWPKNRHIKHRLIHPPFVQELHRILCPCSSVTFVTDDDAYSQWGIHMMTQGNPSFISEFAEPYYKTELSEYGSSYFDQLWRQKGKKIRYHRFCK